MAYFIDTEMPVLAKKSQLSSLPRIAHSFGPLGPCSSGSTKPCAQIFHILCGKYLTAEAPLKGFSKTDLTLHNNMEVNYFILKTGRIY